MANLMRELREMSLEQYTAYLMRGGLPYDDISKKYTSMITQ